MEEWETGDWKKVMEGENPPCDMKRFRGLLNQKQRK